MTVVCKIAISALFCLLAAGCGGVIYPPIQTAAPSASPTAPSSSPQTPPPSTPPLPPKQKPIRFIFAVARNEPPHDIGYSGMGAFSFRDGVLSSNNTRDLGPAVLHTSYVALSPRNKAIYIIKGCPTFSSCLDVYAIDSNGQLSNQLQDSFRMPYVSSAPVIDPSDNFLFLTADDGLHEYRIDATADALTEMPGSPYAVGGLQSARGAVMHPSGKFLYVSRGDQGTWGLALNAGTGVLTDLPGNPFTSSVDVVNAVDQCGKFLYVHQWRPADVSQIYSINDDGSIHLQQASASGKPLRCAANTGLLTAMFYGGVPHFNDAELEAWAVDSANGSLVPVAGSPFILPDPPNGEGHNIVATAVDSWGDLLYVASAQSIFVLKLNNDGTPQLPPIAQKDVYDGTWTFFTWLAVSK